jgi:hypothetical protein
MMSGIADYYPVTIFFAIASVVLLPFCVVGARRWLGAAVVGNTTTISLTTPATDAGKVRNIGLRRVAIYGSTDQPTGRMRSIARQSVASRIRALEDGVSTSPHDLPGLASNFAARRPGLQKASPRGGHRLAVVR